MNRNCLYIIMLFLFAWGNNNVFPQAAIDLNHNSMRIGDVVKKHRVLAYDVWDMSQSEKCGDDVTDSYEDFKTDTTTCLSSGMRKYYVLHSDTLLYVGSENPQHTEAFYIPETSCVYPMSLGDRYEGCFAGHIEYCDKMRFHKYGTYSVHADSIGTLTLPDGNSVGDVLQVCRKRRCVYVTIDKDSDLDTLTYSRDEILQRLAAVGEAYTEIEKELYAKGYRYPVVRDFRLYTPNEELYKHETYYYPLFEQECLPLDEANIQARNEQHDAEGNDSAGGSGNVFSFISRNPGTMEVVFNSEGYMASRPLHGAVQCSFLLSDSKGIVYRTSRFSLGDSSNPEVRLSYSGLRPGQYIISLVIDGQIHPNNFIIE